MDTITLPDLNTKEHLELSKTVGKAIIQELRLPAVRAHPGHYRYGGTAATPAAIGRTLMSLIQNTIHHHENHTNPNEHKERTQRQARQQNI